MKKILLIISVILLYIVNINGQDSAGVSIPFEIYDNGIDGGGYRLLHFGLDLTATDTIDFHLGESDLPPFPPLGAFEARFILPAGNFNGTLSSYRDYRNAASFPVSDTIIHRVRYQAKDGADTMFFAWNFPDEVSGLLQDIVTGTIVNLPISGEGVFAFTQFDALNQLQLTVYYDAILPVELSSFSASVTGKGVVLNWSTASEVNNAGFEVERRVHSPQSSVGNWSRVGYVEGNGTTTDAKTYSFIDNSVTTGSYSYRLKQIDFDGSFNYSNVIEVDVDLTPTGFGLEQNYPNPFNPSTMIGYQLPVSSNVSLKVYDVLGREVATLVNEFKEVGSYEVEFKALNLSSGVYIYKLQADNIIETRKMTLMR